MYLFICKNLPSFLNLTLKFENYAKKFNVHFEQVKCKKNFEECRTKLFFVLSLACTFNQSIFKKFNRIILKVVRTKDY